MGDDEDDDDSLLAAVARIPVRAEAWKPPKELDEYRLIEPLGRGGMGSVWLAHDRLLDRLVAIKFIANEPSSQARERFAIEARAAARLQHPNVVSVYRYGELDGRPYLVAEYIRGEPLDKLVTPLPWSRVLELGVALVRGLAAAHRHGIVHRDIKPANAILSADGDAKLVDFGLARLEGSAELPGVVGTPRYLAPEVRRGEVADRRTDIYGIGCVLYELSTGKAPLLDAAGPLVGRIEGPLAAIIDRCLAVAPADRYASGDELRDALEALQAPASLGGELPAGNPYRGLMPYDAEHRGLFFGRGSAIRSVVERLRGDGFVVVAGDSGAGKSSLCRAGVLPAIVDGALDRRAWKVVAFVPSRHPISTLAALLAPMMALDETEVAARLRDKPSEIARALRGLGPETGTVIFVDQLEELCTLTDREDVEAISRVLGELATGGPGVRLIATVRSDFLSRVAALPGLGDEIARGIYLLHPLTEDGVRDAVTGPARAKGVTVEPSLVDELVATSSDTTARIELPLLAFTLAQLWEARDPTTQQMTIASLVAIGGVRGALARHADGVLDELIPDQRGAARRVLLRLVTPELTRARRSADELGDEHRAALDALVRGRLVVARGETYELAHERLIDGWPTLAHWVADTTEAIAARERLTAAVAAWERLGRARDALWAQRQLVDLELISDDELAGSERDFAIASRRAVWRRRWMRRGIAIAIPAIAIGLYATVKLVARRDLAGHIATNVGEADRHLLGARIAVGESRVRAAEAFAAFDVGRKADGETAWGIARKRSGEARIAFAQAARALEAAFLLDTDREDVRRELAEVTAERIDLAAQEHRLDETAELEARLQLYDTSGDLAASRARPVHLVTAIEPRTASVVVMTAGSPQTIVSGSELAPGSYLITAGAPGRATVRVPLVARSRHPVQLAFELPASVPAGFVYVPPGTFLSGSRDDEFMRAFLDAPPMHERVTDGYLIAEHEVTYAEWIAFLDAQPGDVRERHRPRIENSTTVQSGGALELRKTAAGWELHITPAGISYVSQGETLTYRERTQRTTVAWKKLPVSGITVDDAAAYAAWLATTKQVPKARLCTELEWERAARGADGRPHPGGERLAPDDANFDETYGRKDGGFGPDEVGAHLASDSLFGLHDTSGNVWELLRTGGVVAMRGGGYYTGSITAHLANRQEIPPAFKHLHVGVRLCADP